ncbi:MAG TPA: YfiR family protein [Ktedonosporobacter sp.]|jgi:hypothetical protein|nr:YfiR family protein [Ktedonosporobacter sp.]
MAAGSKEVIERRAKIGYICNFLKSVTWPREIAPRNTWIADVCIVGDRKLSKHFEAIVKSNPDHSMTINVSYSTTGATIPDCHILFIDKSARVRLASILERAGNRPILTVSDIKGFADKGGMIELVKVREVKATYLRPRINSTTAEISSITLGAELLFMADHTQQEELLIISDHVH